MSDLETLTQGMRTAVGTDSGLGKTLKYDLKGEGFIFVDKDSVSNEDKPADLVMTINLADLTAMSSGKLAPMTAVLTGKLKMSDMPLAMSLQGPMTALAARVPKQGQ